MWIKDHSGGQWGICQNYFGADFTLSSFSISAVPLTTNVWLRWTAPNSCGFTNNTVYIHWSTTGYPATSSDGIEIYSGTNTVFEHTGLDASGAVTNYYTIWATTVPPTLTSVPTTMPPLARTWEEFVYSGNL